jgi:hypothetical protein
MVDVSGTTVPHHVALLYPDLFVFPVTELARFNRSSPIPEAMLALHLLPAHPEHCGPQGITRKG